MLPMHWFYFLIFNFLLIFVHFLGASSPPGLVPSPAPVQLPTLAPERPRTRGYIGSVPTAAIAYMPSPYGGNVTFRQLNFPWYPVTTVVNITGLQPNSIYMLQISENGPGNGAQGPDCSSAGVINLMPGWVTTDSKGTAWKVIINYNITLQGDFTSVIGRAFSLSSTQSGGGGSSGFTLCTDIGLTDEEAWCYSPIAKCEYPYMSSTTS